MSAAGAASGEQLLLRRQQREEMAAVQRRIAAGRDRVASASASAALRGALLYARSCSRQTLSRQEELTGLKNQLRDLEAHLAKALSSKLCMESKCELAKESISSSAAINQQLEDLVTHGRNKRDQRTAIISNELRAVGALEAKNSENETWRKDVENTIFWYQKFLGFQVVAGGEGAKFVFDKVGLQNPEMEYSFSLKLNKDTYTLLRCSTPVKDSEELVKDLNLTNNLFKFVRIMRQRFQAASVNGTCLVSPVVCPDAPSIPVSSPVVTSVDSRSRTVADQSHSQSKNKKQAIPTKRRAPAILAASPGAVRRSPRISAASPGARSPHISAASPGDMHRSSRLSVIISSPGDTFPLDDCLEEHGKW